LKEEEIRGERQRKATPKPRRRPAHAGQFWRYARGAERGISPAAPRPAGSQQRRGVSSPARRTCSEHFVRRRVYNICQPCSKCCSWRKTFQREKKCAN